MKHLKKFNESAIENFFKPRINWKFVYNIQDVVQLYLDSGYDISCSISLNGQMFYAMDSDWFPDDEINLRLAAKDFQDKNIEIEILVNECDDRKPEDVIKEIAGIIKDKYGYTSFMDKGDNTSWSEIIFYIVPKINQN